MPQGYRNNRTGYLTDVLPDNTPVGSIVPNFKSGAGTLDHTFVKSTATSYPTHNETLGNAYLNGDDPAYTHNGYLYCDGSTYNIIDYPQLYELIGNDYGGRSSTGVDVVNGGSGYATTSTVTVTAAPTGGTTAVVTVGSVDTNGKILTMNVSNAGAGYTTAPTITVATGSSATFQVRLDPLTGSIAGINKSNVMTHYGDQYMGTFSVPDTVTRKICGNGPVFGNNSPNVGNSTMGCGTTGGKWYIDQSAQDEYFSLGTIRTTGYDNVIETTECSIIGDQTVTVTMRETKLSGVPQHNHVVHRSIPGDNTWISEYSGDRYLAGYRADTGKLSRWYPSTGEVFTHKHGLLRSPMADNKVATYDVLDYQGGAGGSGSTQNPITIATTSGVSTTNDTITLTDHGLVTGNTLKYKSTSGTAIGGLTVGTTYYAIKVDVNTLKLATTLANAGAGTAVTITSAGSGTQTFVWDTSYAKQKYLASGSSSSGTTQLQTTIPAPIFKCFISTSIVGGRKRVTGGRAVYDYSQVLVDSSSATSGSGSFTGLTGTPDVLIWYMSGGGGSGAAGTTAGNNGGDTWLKIGPSGSEVVNITAQGGRGGKAATSGGTVAGAASGVATFTSSGSETINGQAGNEGQAGSGNKELVSDYATDPGGGGAAGGSGLTVSSTTYGGGTAGVRGRINDSGSLTQTKTSGSHTFDISTVTADPSQVKFTLKGAKGAESSLDTYVGQDQAGGKGAAVTVFIKSSELSNFRTKTWSVKIGNRSTSRNGGTGPLSGQTGGYGGTGYNGAHGGGGGSSAILQRDSQTVAGAGGGGGAGADGYDGGDGMSGGTNSGNAAGQTGGGLRRVQGSTGMSWGDGGGGGNYGCRGGGGGGGGAGAAETGFSGFGGGGAGGDPGSGGHDGGDGGKQGPSAYRDLYFAVSNGEGGAPQFTDHTGNDASIKMEVTWDGSYWTAPGGGGGGAASAQGNINWSLLGSPSGFTYQIGGAGSGVQQSGSNTSGQTGNAENGYLKLGVGTITGYVDGNVTFPAGDVVESASQTDESWDVEIYDGGAGTGIAGFKLPTTQVPSVVFKGGGLGDPPVSPQVHATATATVSSNKVTAVNLATDGNGYTEVPYVYILNGAGTQQFAEAQIDATSKIVSGITYTAANAVVPTKYVKFGGSIAATRWLITTAFDTTNANYFSIKAARGNGINGGDVPEENLTVEYQIGGTTTWSLIDTIINPNSPRTDPLIGTVPKVTLNDATWDGASGATQWYTYSVAIPEAARNAATKFRLKQVRATAGGDNASDTDHYGICEFTVWNQKTSTYVFVPDPGAISKPLVDSLEYTVSGQSGSAFTYTSGLGCGDATMTMKSTTKIEPVANIDPDYGIPLVHPYQHCKYLIKAF